ncbi:MAG: hypothetical protein M1839_008329 [Geoglossum umbratile]|nr:MAG: hypothetical protein M1839_008329 [Geoglossum umbratile]
MALWSPLNLPDFIIAPIQKVNPDEAYECLQNYAFSQGFCIVITSHDNANTYIRYACIHHGHTTRNWYQLDEHRSEERNRQKEYINIRARECPWQVYLSYKGVTKGAEQKAWFLGITNGSHASTHDMVPNPLTYPLHSKRHPQYAASIQQAIALKAA